MVDMKEVESKLGTTLVMSTRVSREIYENFIKTIGPNTCASDALRDLVMDHIARKETRGEGAGQKLISEKEQPSEGATETPSEHGINSEAAYKEPGNAFQTATSKLSSDKTPAISESVKIRSQQCRFYMFNNKRQLVECSKDFITKGRNYLITELTCDWCWNNPKCPGHTEASSGDAEKDDAEENY